jgi:hypothetical protein
MAIIEEEARRNGSRQRDGNRGTGKKGMTAWHAAAILLAAFALAAVPSAAMDNEGAMASPTVIIADYSVTPAVLLPGDLATVTLTIRNTAQSASVKENTGIISGGTFASTKSTDINVYVERVSLEGNGVEVMTEAFDRLGEIGPGQSVPVTFLIRAPAQDGIYFPEVWINVKDGRSTRYPVMVNVNTDISTQKKPALSVMQRLPGRVAPGEDCTAEILITNTGLTRASDVAIGISSTTPSLVLTTPGRYYEDHLDPGDWTNLTIGFATDKNTPTGLDPVTLAISYRNPDGTIESQTEILGIPVKGRADIAVKSFATDPVRPVPGSAFTLVVRVENTGTDRATSVQAALDSPFTGTKTAFIGSIDKDSDAPAIFYLQAVKDGTVPATVTITYTDDYGSHTVTEQATITTAPASGVLPAAAAIFILIIGAGAAYWYFRIRPGKDDGK